MRCQLPTEVDELLRLAVGHHKQIGQALTPNLLDLFGQPDMSPEARQTLSQLRDSVSPETLGSLHDWRNRIGAHIDADTPWSELQEGIDAIDLAAVSDLAENVLLQLEIAAVQPGGPVLLLLSARRMKKVMDVLPAGAAGLSYEDPDVDAGAVTSSLPPEQFDSHHMIFVGGPAGSMLSAAVAGMIAGRNKQLQEKLTARRQRTQKG